MEKKDTTLDVCVLRVRGGERERESDRTQSRESRSMQFLSHRCPKTGTKIPINSFRSKNFFFFKLLFIFLVVRNLEHFFFRFVLLRV